MAESSIFSGRNRDYQWVQARSSEVPIHLPDLLLEIPDLVLGKHVLVAACDGDSLILSPVELAAGWSIQARTATSPRIADVAQLPCDEFDEWYIFDYPPRLDNPPEVFVNFGTFELRDPDHIVTGLHPTWDRAGAQHLYSIVRDQQQRFWSQLFHIAPETYLSTGDHFICATKRERLFHQILDAFTAAARGA